MEKINIVFLDAKTLGEDISLAHANEIGNVKAYPTTASEDIAARIQNAHVVVVNKIKLNETNLQNAAELRLICVLATGYDNIDTEYCRTRGIAVCNVAGYSSVSVAQLSVSLVLSLVNHLNEYTEFVRSGDYTRSGVANRLIPVYREISSLTWGVIGAGNIGMCVADTAAALGANVILNRRNLDAESKYQAADIDTVVEKSDIISIHTPLNSDTKNLISRDRLSKMKNGVIIVNTARGAVLDEDAIADAVLDGKIGGFGCDVYSIEPLPQNHPYFRIINNPNVLLTPHMAWGAYEARQRCLAETLENIKAFFAGKTRSRIV